jgi:hypothetical protein
LNYWKLEARGSSGRAGPRFWAVLKRYLDILFLILVLRSCSWIVDPSVLVPGVLVPGVLVPGVLVPGPRFWRFVPGILVLDVAITGSLRSLRSLESLGSRARRSRLRRVVAGEL